MYYHIGEGGKRYWGKKGAGIVFTDGSHILLLRRTGSHHGGTWCIPGGKSEDGELPIDTAKRECEEEIGGVEGTRFAKFDEKDGQFVFTVFLFKVDKPFQAHLNEEHDEYKWVPLDKIKYLPLHPEFEKHYKYYLKAIHKKFNTNFTEWMSYL